jgi:hypothetical protein
MEQAEHSWKSFYKVAAIVALIFVAYSLVTMVVLLTIGGAPESAREAFDLLAKNRLVGLLRLDALTLLVLPLYYPLFLGLYVGLKTANRAYASLSALLAIAGVTLFLATPSAFSLLPLSDEYAAAKIPARREQLLAAGEALLASDMWHGSGAMIGGFLMLIATLILSLIMLKSECFGKWTAIVGLLTHGLDLTHSLVSLVSPQIGLVFMMIAGPLYLVWFPLLARDFFRLGQE